MTSGLPYGIVTSCIVFIMPDHLCLVPDLPSEDDCAPETVPVVPLDLGNRSAQEALLKALEGLAPALKQLQSGGREENHGILES